MSANQLTVKGFVNKINYVASSAPGESDMYFANIAYQNSGKGDDRRIQYMSCFVSKSLHRLAQAAFESQKTEEDGKVFNILGSQYAELTIINPFFEINDSGYLDGSGILTAISFVTPERKPESSQGNQNQNPR